jgi:hypothetical protein
MPRAARAVHIGISAGWSSPVARQAHNLKVIGSNPIPATKKKASCASALAGFFIWENADIWAFFAVLPNARKFNDL